MTFREKILWVSAIAVAAIWGSYLFDIVQGIASGEPQAAAAYGGFVKSVLLLVGVHIVASVVLAIANPTDASAPNDARDREIARRGSLPAYSVLALMIVVIMIVTPSVTASAPALLIGEPATVTAIVLGNALLFALVVAELVNICVQLVHYRRGV